MRVPGGSILIGLVLAAGCGGSVVSGTADAGGGSGAVGTGASPANTGGSGPGVGGSAPGVGGGATAGAGGSAGTTVLPGQCTDPADMAAYKATYPAPDGATVSIHDIAQACALGCLSDADPNHCTVSCIEQQTNHAFSVGCAECFAISMNCGLANCVVDCLNGGAQCNACLCAHGCVAATVACTGIADNTCSTSGG